jgi:hypothetical protein
MELGPQEFSAAFHSNQRCCESAGGEIVITGLSGFAGVAAVAGEGCAGACFLCSPQRRQRQAVRVVGPVHERREEQQGGQHTPEKCAPEGRRCSNQRADKN